MGGDQQSLQMSQGDWVWEEREWLSTAPAHPCTVGLASLAAFD